MAARACYSYNYVDVLSSVLLKDLWAQISLSMPLVLYKFAFDGGPTSQRYQCRLYSWSGPGSVVVVWSWLSPVVVQVGVLYFLRTAVNWLRSALVRTPVGSK